MDIYGRWRPPHFANDPMRTHLSISNALQYQQDEIIFHAHSPCQTISLANKHSSLLDSGDSYWYTKSRRHIYSQRYVASLLNILQCNKIALFNVSDIIFTHDKGLNSNLNISGELKTLCVKIEAGSLHTAVIFNIIINLVFCPIPSTI